LEGKYLYASASGPWVRDSLFIYQFLSFTTTSTSSEGNSRRSRGKHTELENIHAGPSSNLFGTVTLVARVSHCTDAQPKYKHIATHSASRRFSLQPQHSSGSQIQPRNQRATIRTPTWNLPRKSLGYLRAINTVTDIFIVTLPPNVVLTRRTQRARRLRRLVLRRLHTQQILLFKRTVASWSCLQLFYTYCSILTIAELSQNSVIVSTISLVRRLWKR
jgi:hypothetical protein